MDIIFNIGEKKGEFDSFIPLLSSFIGAFIGAITVFYTVNRTNKTKLKELLVQTISEERIRWINTLRDEFVEFNKNIVVYKAIIDEHEGDSSSEENRKFEEVIASIHRITLLLNPSEHYMQYLIEEINGLSQASSTIRGEYDPQPFIDAKWRITDLQQVILKAEWARVKKESKTGKELSDKEIKGIYDETAKGINTKIFDFVEDWIRLEKEPLEEDL